MAEQIVENVDSRLERIESEQQIQRQRMHDVANDVNALKLGQKEIEHNLGDMVRDVKDSLKDQARTLGDQGKLLEKVDRAIDGNDDKGGIKNGLAEVRATITRHDTIITSLTRLMWIVITAIIGLLVAAVWRLMMMGTGAVR